MEVLRLPIIYTDLYYAITTEIIALVILVVYSIVAGVYLSFKLKPRAVWIAKSYFVTEIITAVPLAIIYSQVSYSSAMQDAGFGWTAGDILRTLAASGIWIYYLSNSKRVKATYKL